MGSSDASSLSLWRTRLRGEREVCDGLAVVEQLLSGGLSEGSNRMVGLGGPLAG